MRKTRKIRFRQNNIIHPPRRRIRINAVPPPQTPIQSTFHLNLSLFFAACRILIVCRYRATSNIHLPFRVHPIITEHSRTRVSYEIAIKANFSPKLYATDVLVRIPTPLNAAEGKWRCSQGRAKWELSENVVEWKYHSSISFSSN